MRLIESLGKLLKRNVFFLILVPVTIISQIIILEPHLKYGFSDVDWGFLSIYKTQNPYSFSQFIKNFEQGGTRGGIYTHQIYYIGIQHHFFELNFKLFHLTTHIFRILAILSVFPLLLAISGSALVAFISTLIFGFSYSAVGTLYTVVTSSDYSAIFSMGIFLMVYWYMIKQRIGNWSLLIVLLLLLILTLFLSTERMYQLPLFIFLAEIFLIWQRRKLDKQTVKRLLIMFLPLLLIFFARPMVFLSYFLSHISEITEGIADGNWNLLLTPVIALGSILVPHDYIKFLGQVKIDSFDSFAVFLLTGPLIYLMFITIMLGILVFRKSRIAILQILLLMVIFSSLLYILGSHFTTHQIAIGSIVQALIGFYIISLSIVSFSYWVKYKERLFIGLFVGPFFAILYIFLTWLGAAAAEVFAGVHRYLTIPALLMSLFLGALFTIMFNTLCNSFKKFKKLKFIGLIIFIPLIFFIRLNIQEIGAFFYYQLRSGFGADDKNLMRNQLNSYLDNLSITKPSLFYFDFTEDNDNGYYYDNTLLGGFASWMLWHPHINFNQNLAPKTLGGDPKLIKSYIQISNEQKVIIYENKVYDIRDFYAFSLKNKKVIDIKYKILNE